MARYKADGYTLMNVLIPTVANRWNQHPEKLSREPAHMKKSPRKPTAATGDTDVVSESTIGSANSDTNDAATLTTTNTHLGSSDDVPTTQSSHSLPPSSKGKAIPRKVDRGLAASVSTRKLKDGIWLRALLLANRFRVIRTIDVAALCFPERGYKASLTAAQRAMRGIVKAQLLGRYRSSRFQTIYGLSQRGADWLDEAGHDATSSVRRVSDMTNPEHRLWAQFWVLACEARGIRARSEIELLEDLNKDTKMAKPAILGLLGVTTTRGKKESTVQLRPDAVAYEPDGLTWLEVDRSKRSSAREESLKLLFLSIGKKLKDGTLLRRVVVFCKSERIYKRAIAAAKGLADAHNEKVLTLGRRHFREVEPGTYEVWAAPETKLTDGRTKLVDTLTGHLVIQLLPIWLPKVRIDSTNTHSMSGWFDENYLPYRRPSSLGPWKSPVSPLLAPLKCAPGF